MVKSGIEIIRGNIWNGLSYEKANRIVPYSLIPSECTGNIVNFYLSTF